MCGIIHVKKLTPGDRAAKSVIRRYQTQKSRGKEGFGFIEIKNGIVTTENRAQTEKEILDLLKNSTADEILFHHRFPTSTPNFVESTHPIYVSHDSLQYDYFITHNGVISNDEELRKKHLEAGFVYTTDTQKKWHTTNQVYYEDMQWNDSEAFAIDLALSLENEQKMESRGSIAFVALQFEKRTKKAIALYYGRNLGNPLKREKHNKFFSLSSETGEMLVTDTLYRYDYETGISQAQEKSIGVYYGYKKTEYSTPAMGFKWTKEDEKKDEKRWWEKDGEMDNPYEEEDFGDDVLDVRGEIDILTRRMDVCLSDNDYDRAIEIEEEIEELKAKLPRKVWLIS